MSMKEACPDTAVEADAGAAAVELNCSSGERLVGLTARIRRIASGWNRRWTASYGGNACRRRRAIRPQRGLSGMAAKAITALRAVRWNQSWAQHRM